jgi:hypothetical protein
MIKKVFMPSKAKAHSVINLVLKNNQLIDSQSDAVWDMDGKCISGNKSSRYPKYKLIKSFGIRGRPFNPIL